MTQDSIVTVIISTLITILFTAGLWAWQRRVTKNDRDDTKTLDGLGTRVTLNEKDINEIRVQLERRVTWDELSEFKKEIKDDMEKVATRLELAINSLRPGHG